MGNFTQNGGISTLNYSQERDWLMKDVTFSEWIQGGAIIEGEPVPTAETTIYPLALIGDSIVGNEGATDILSERIEFYAPGSFDTLLSFSNGASTTSAPGHLANVNYDASKPKHFIFVFYGVNDVNNDQTGAAVLASPKAQTLANKIKDVVSLARLKGANVEVIVSTIQAFSLTDSTRDTLRKDANALIKTGSGANYVVDWGSHFWFGEKAFTENKELFTDGVHITDSSYDFLAILLLDSVGRNVNNPIQAIFKPYKSKIIKGQSLKIAHADFGGDTNNVYQWFRVSGEIETLIHTGANPDEFTAAQLPAGLRSIKLVAKNGTDIKTRSVDLLVQMPNSSGNGFIDPPESAVANGATVNLTSQGITSPKWIKQSGAGVLTGSGNSASYVATGTDETAVIRAEEEFWQTVASSDSQNRLTGNLSQIDFGGVARLTRTGHFYQTAPIIASFGASNRIGVKENSSGRAFQVYGNGNLVTVEGAGGTTVTTAVGVAAGDVFQFVRAGRKLQLWKKASGAASFTMAHETADETLAADGTTFFLYPFASFWTSAQTIGAGLVGGESPIGEQPTHWNSAEALIYVA